MLLAGSLLAWVISQCLTCAYVFKKGKPQEDQKWLVQHAAAVAACRESAGMGGPLNEEEAHVIQGVLDLSSKTGSKAMTTLDKVFERLNF